jgi:phage repressor protein C with HTH and peptisase S24 domain
MTNSRMSQKFREGIWDSVKELQTVTDRTGYNLDWIITGEGAEKGDTPLVHIPAKGKQTIDLSEAFRKEETTPRVQDSSYDYLKGKVIRPITVTVDRQGKELITYVPVRAQAGYMKGYGDAHYIEKLPAFSLPILKNGSYRMFEVDGESMLQVGGGGLHDGDIVIAQYLEDITSMRDNRVYVIVSTEGVIVKRCLNRLKEKENAVLVCKSDNKNGQYPDIIIRPHEIIEVWELKAFISKQLSFGTDMWQMISDVEVKLAMMDEKIKRMEQERLAP